MPPLNFDPWGRLQLEGTAAHLEALNLPDLPAANDGGGEDDDENRPPVLRAYFGAGEIHVDLFAGGGGASVGAAKATGRSPDVAINHSPAAIAMHAANHPTTRHYIEDVYQVDPRRAAAGRSVALLWMSPTCTHFSKAKGDALDESSLKIRGLAWSVLPWIVHTRPKIIILENVEEFLKWGPLHQTHSDGCSDERAARNKRRWDADTSPLTARRKRFGFGASGCLIGCHRHKPIKVREGETFRAFVKKIRSKGYWVEWRILKAHEYGAPTTRKRLYMIMSADGEPRAWPEPSHGPGPGLQPYRTAAECIDWSIPCPSIFGRKDPLADKTMARIARGVQKFVILAARPFIVPVSYGSKNGTDVRANSIDEPMRTICGNRGGHSVIVPIVVKAKTHGGGGNEAMAANEPLRTITASKRGEFAISTATIVRTAHGDVDAKGKRRGQSAHDIEQPLGTVCASGTDFAIAVPTLRPSGRRPGTAAKCVAFLNKHNGGHESAGGGQAVDRPVDALVGANNKSVTLAHVVRYNGERRAGEARGGQLDLPLPTQDTSNRFALATSHLCKLRGTSEAHVDSCSQAVDEPVPTISASGMHVAEVRAFLVRYNGQSVGQLPSDPLGTLDTTDRYALATVVIDGELWEIVDIGMRMLTPAELFRAQGFGPEYVIDPIGPKGKPLTKTEQIRAVGNSVCPPVAEAIVSAVFAPAPAVFAEAA
jgi:DNA (cytosine-5)-methyltransferase 1